MPRTPMHGGRRKGNAWATEIVIGELKRAQYRGQRPLRDTLPAYIESVGGGAEASPPVADYGRALPFMLTPALPEAARLSSES
jgi:hypothetical protein